MPSSLIAQALIDPGGGGSAGCNPGGGTEGIDLGDCFYLNAEGDTVRSFFGTPTDLINLLVRNAFVLAGLVIFFMILYGGYRYIEGGTKGAEEAKGIFQAVLIGFLLMFGAFWIVQLIKLITGAPFGL